MDGEAGEVIGLVLWRGDCHVEMASMHPDSLY